MWVRWVVVVLGVVLGGWLLFDGTHAFVTGDFVTPRSGEHAGELGPWSRIVFSLGIDPRSAVMKTVHIGLGAAWLAAAVAFAIRSASGWRAILGCAIASLWYAPFGTAIGLVSLIALLAQPALRG